MPPLFLCIQMLMFMVMAVVMAMVMAVPGEKLEVTFCDHKILEKNLKLEVEKFDLKFNLKNEKSL